MGHRGLMRYRCSHEKSDFIAAENLIIKQLYTNHTNHAWEGRICNALHFI